MTERDIKGNVTALQGAIVTNREGEALDAAMWLLTQALVDLNRIAQALEHIATKKG